MKIVTFGIGLIAFGGTLVTAILLTLHSFQLATISLPMVVHSAIITFDIWLIFALLLGLSAFITPSAKQEPSVKPLEQSRLRRAR